ncbi:hypothetical protein D3C81_1616010 [compost metagenome]
MTISRLAGVTSRAPSTAPVIATRQPAPNSNTMAAGNDTKATKVGCQSPLAKVQPHNAWLSSKPKNELVNTHGHNPLP